MEDKSEQLSAVRCQLKVLILKWQAVNELKLTYEDLALMTGVTDKTLRRWANNKVNSYAAHVLVSLCQFFSVEVGDILVFNGGKSEPET